VTSRHEVLVYRVLAKREWITSREIAERTGVAPRTARAHLRKLALLGVVDFVEAFDGYRYRMTEDTANRNREYSDRIARDAEVLGLQG
jgi:predicted ArsR family transcriptional regulator